jgi:Nucleoside-diphosphate-sugar epimerases
VRTLVTGSAGHLDEALVLTLRERGEQVENMDVKASPFTDMVGSVADRRRVTANMDCIDAVLHAKTLHKLHVVTHSRQDFDHTNVSGDHRAPRRRRAPPA